MIAENTERQIGLHPNVTIRHARNALHLLIKGAVIQIVESVGPNDEADAPTAQLLEGLQEEISGWKGTTP